MSEVKKLNKHRDVKANVESPLTPGAIHAHDAAEKVHAVGIWDIRVFIVPDGKFWFAQGLEIDYAAQGASVDEAKRNFEDGLEATIDLHLRMHGNIEGLLKVAPSQMLYEALKDKDSIEVYEQVSVHDIGPQARFALRFEGISYLVAKEAA